MVIVSIQWWDYVFIIIIYHRVPGPCPPCISKKLTWNPLLHCAVMMNWMCLLLLLLLWLSPMNNDDDEVLTMMPVLTGKLSFAFGRCRCLIMETRRRCAETCRVILFCHLKGSPKCVRKSFIECRLNVECRFLFSINGNRVAAVRMDHKWSLPSAMKWWWKWFERH